MLQFAVRSAGRNTGPDAGLAFLRDPEAKMLQRICQFNTLMRFSHELTSRVIDPESGFNMMQFQYGNYVVPLVMLGGVVQCSGYVVVKVVFDCIKETISLL